jgi:hypothetical protein
VKLILRIINQIEDFLRISGAGRQVGAGDYGHLRSIPVAWSRERLTGTSHLRSTGSYLQETNPELYPSSKPM